MVKRLHVTISGLVQGVFFRASTREEARSLNLGGWVKNLPDGRVEAVFEGEEEKLSAMLEWCRHGPPGSRPEAIETAWSDGAGESTDFKITY